MEEKCYIGDLYTPKLDSEWVIRSKGASTAGFSDEEWSLAKRTKLSPTTYIFEFNNQKFNVKLDIKGSRWIGRHYVLSNTQKSRLYTNCTMLDPKIIEYREKLIKWYEKEIENKGEGVQGDKIEYPQETENLTLVIKAYEGTKALSKELSNTQIGNRFMIQGPIVKFLFLHFYLKKAIKIKIKNF